MIYSVTATGQFGFAIASSKAEALAFSCDSSSTLRVSESFNSSIAVAESDSNPAIASFNPAIASSLTATSFAAASNVVSNVEISSLALSNSASKSLIVPELFVTIINKATTRTK